MSPKHRNRVQTVNIYFTHKDDRHPAGARFCFHRKVGEEMKWRARRGSPSSWRRLRQLINTSPGHLVYRNNGFLWRPHKAANRKGI